MGRRLGQGVANRDSSEEGKGDLQSSEPLLDDDHHHLDNLDNDHSHSPCAKGTRWTQIQPDDSKASGYGALALVSAPHRPRRTMNCHDDYDKEKDMRRVRRRLCARLGVGMLIFLGIIQLFSVLSGLIIVFTPDGVHRIIEKWGQIGHSGQGLSSWPTDFSRGILPIPLHSHNDYWRRVPLYSAVEVGCISVEADVWLFDEQLYVGHSLASLTPNRTLASLYVDPLVRILENQNPATRFHPQGNSTHHGVFDTDPEQSLTLLIDFKTSGTVLFPHIVSALEPLRSRGYLSHRNGSAIVSRPIIVVGTGNTPFNLVDSAGSNPHHDIFFDAPLEVMWEGLPNEKQPPVQKSGSLVYGADIDASMPELAATDKEKRIASDDMGQGKSGAPDSPEAYTISNSFYASVSFTQAIGHVLSGKLSESQMGLIRGHIRGAHRRGLKVRYWELPFWPIGLRNYVWEVLVNEGVDILNVDDLKAAARRDWTTRKGWWSS
ncbi:MAG: hypothetical protein Q9208_000440 [Pyrenodesmia sp. 3 TL-2023]